VVTARTRREANFSFPAPYGNSKVTQYTETSKQKSSPNHELVDCSPIRLSISPVHRIDAGPSPSPLQITPTDKEILRYLETFIHPLFIASKVPPNYRRNLGHRRRIAAGRPGPIQILYPPSVGLQQPREPGLQVVLVLLRYVDALQRLCMTMPDLGPVLSQCLIHHPFHPEESWCFLQWRGTVFQDARRFMTAFVESSRSHCIPAISRLTLVCSLVIFLSICRAQGRKAVVGQLHVFSILGIEGHRNSDPFRDFSSVLTRSNPPSLLQRSFHHVSDLLL